MVGRPGTDSESWRSVLGGAEEMQRCYNVSNLLSTLISTQRKKKKKPRGELGQRNDEEDRVGGVIVPNNRYSPTYSGGNRSALKKKSCYCSCCCCEVLKESWDICAGLHTPVTCSRCSPTARALTETCSSNLWIGTTSAAHRVWRRADADILWISLKYEKKLDGKHWN